MGHFHGGKSPESLKDSKWSFVPGGQCLGAAKLGNVLKVGKRLREKDTFFLPSRTVWSFFHIHGFLWNGKNVPPVGLGGMENNIFPVATCGVAKAIEAGEKCSSWKRCSAS